MSSSREGPEIRSAFRRQDLEDFFETFLPELSRLQLLWPRDWARMPAVDLVDRGDEYLLTAEMPGVRREDLEISILNEQVTIKGSVRRAEQAKGQTVVRQERLYGDFVRNVRLPAPVETDATEARLENGLLILKLMKTRDVRPKRIEIQSD